MKKRYYILIALAVFFLLINLPFFFIGSEEIVRWLGIENTYLVVFLIAALGGISSFTGTVWFSVLVGFASGGASPVILGIISGIGIFISDSIFYHLALYGKKSLPDSWQTRIRKILNFVHQTPSWIILGLSFIYLGFTVLPADILMIILALSGYSYRKIFPVLLLGSLVISLLIAHLGKALL